MVAQQRNATKIAVVACAAVLLKHATFVPAPKAAHTRVSAAAVGAAAAAAAAGATPAFADKIGDAAVKLSKSAYPFMKEVDWNSMLYLSKPGTSGSTMDWLKAVDKAIVMGSEMDSKLLKDAAMSHHGAILSIDEKGVLSESKFSEVNAAIGRLFASVPEATTMDVYNSFKPLVGSDVPEYLMSTVKAEDARLAYTGLLNFKDVVKANPIGQSEPGRSAISGVKLAKVDEAAAKLSAAAYPFVKSVEWTSDLYLKPLPGVSAKAALKAVDSAIVMGAAMDGGLLKEAAEAHHKAIGSVDAKGVTSAADFTAVTAALGKLIASVPRSEVMDVYTQFSKIVDPTIPNYMFSSIPNKADAFGAYKALLDFTNVVKAASSTDMCRTMC